MSSFAYCKVLERVVGLWRFSTLRYFIPRRCFCHMGLFFVVFSRGKRPGCAIHIFFSHPELILFVFGGSVVVSCVVRASAFSPSADRLLCFLAHLAVAFSLFLIFSFRLLRPLVRLFCRCLRFVFLLISIAVSHFCFNVSCIFVFGVIF